MQKEFFHYNKDSKQFARTLRKNTTLSEYIMWNEILKARKLKGYQFHRQKPIDKYIVDFFCKELKSIIELDGITHEGNTEKDLKRQGELEDLGYSIIRFKDSEMEDLFKVKSNLERWIEDYEQKNPDVLKIKNRKLRSNK